MPCATCRRSYHRDCVVPVVDGSVKLDEAWSCPACNGFPSADYVVEVLVDMQKQLVHKVVECDINGLFARPVFLDFASADYVLTILQPMDLQTIKEKLRRRFYPSLSAICEDIRLMISNCLLYNRAVKELVEYSLEIRSKFESYASSCFAALKDQRVCERVGGHVIFLRNGTVSSSYVPKPVISPAVERATVFSSPIRVSIFGGPLYDDDAIRFSTDGSDPSLETAQRYTLPFVVSTTTEVKAVVVSSRGRSQIAEQKLCFDVNEAKVERVDEQPKPREISPHAELALFLSHVVQINSLSTAHKESYAKVVFSMLSNDGAATNFDIQRVLADFNLFRTVNKS